MILWKYSTVFLFFSGVLFFLGILYLKTSNLIEKDVLITNNQMNNINNLIISQKYDLTGTYTINDLKYVCTIYDKKNVGDCENYILSEYILNNTQLLYVDIYRKNRCYAKNSKNNSEVNYKIGIAMCIFAVIFLVILPATLIVIKIIENKNKQHFKNLNNIINMELSSAFQINNDLQKYKQLPVSDFDV